MPAFTARVTLAIEKLLGDQWGVTGVPVAYRIASAKLVGADRENGQTFLLSAELSAHPLTITPLGVSAQALLFVLMTDQPVDIRTNAANDSQFLSGVTLWAMAGSLSNVFLTTGSADTTVWFTAAGGSNTTRTTTFPLP